MNLERASKNESLTRAAMSPGMYPCVWLSISLILKFFVKLILKLFFSLFFIMCCMRSMFLCVGVGGKTSISSFSLLD